MIFRPYLPHEIPSKTDNDPRLGHLVSFDPSNSQNAEVVIIGFPGDEGVARNRGRIGSSKGPRPIREALYKLTPDPRNYESFCRILKHTVDLGDLSLLGETEQDTQILAGAVAHYLEKNCIVIILGGGHEASFGHFLGYTRANRSVSIINFDAHPDVRELRDKKGHSGSPFRQALKDPSKKCLSYTVAGLLPQHVAKSHLDFLKENKANFYFRDEVNEELLSEIFAPGEDSAMVSFDLDGLDSCHSPAVSAPAAVGLSIDIWLKAARSAGQCQKVRSMDIVELNPKYDTDSRGARVAALTVWEFLRGLAER
jgi:formiminoglutamase